MPRPLAAGIFIPVFILLFPVLLLVALLVRAKLGSSILSCQERPACMANLSRYSGSAL